MAKNIAKCPNCKKVLEVIPSKKKKCNFCGKYIYVRTKPDTRKKVLVSEKGTKKIDLEWKNVINLKQWNQHLINLGLKQKEINETIKKFNNKIDKNSKRYSSNDAIWNLLNNLIVINIKDIQKLKQVYYEMALFINCENKNPNKQLEIISKLALVEFKKLDIKKVEISSVRGGCNSCEKQNNKVYSIEEALKCMPIPNKKCAFHLKEGKFPFCRCFLSPIILESYNK